VFRSLSLRKKLLPALLAAMLTAIIPTARAEAGQGCVLRSDGYCVTGRIADVYAVDVYYYLQGVPYLYGRYYAARYRGNGAIDWGGAQYAVSDIQGRGLQFTYSSQYWRTTNNG